MNLRPATPADVPTLFRLIQALAKYEKLSHAVTGSTALLADHLFGARRYAEALLAEVDGQPVGFALFFYNYSTFLTKPGIYLEDLFVLPEYRRQGIARAMLTHLAQRAVAEGCGRFEWSVLDWNQPAIAFYEKIGASVLPDWRICRVSGEALGNLAGNWGLMPLGSSQGKTWRDFKRININRLHTCSDSGSRSQEHPCYLLYVFQFAIFHHLDCGIDDGVCVSIAVDNPGSCSWNHNPGVHLARSIF
ncbi:GNAT family N-acetyltransferase [Kovacikia minuta]|uniref:GNAT family N-acetyltransferase n=1 Tax=Kovacikia minuta TaxID=2931930 RepID=UPI0036F3786E